MWILALEASTTSAKAMLYNTVTKTVEEKIEPYESMYGEEFLHDACKVFNCMVENGKNLSEGKKVEIISLSAAWHSVMLCDSNMQPSTPVYPWSYTGASEVCKKLRENQCFVDEYYKRTGCMVNATYPFFKLLYLKEQGYQLDQYYIMGQGTYNNYRLTGQRVASPCLISGSGLLNIHTKKYDQKNLKMAGIKEEQLSVLTDSRQTFPLSKEGAALLGQKEGIPVIHTNADGGLNQIGVGAIEENIMTFSMGTSGAMRISTSKPAISKSRGTWCYLSPQGWLSGAAVAGCCNCVDWFVKYVAGDDIPYKELEKEIEDVSDTPIFLPFLFGERCPGWDDERSGGFMDVKPYHDIGDMYRGVLQGILFNLYQCYLFLTEVTGEPKKIKLSGGILHSKMWTQMCADIFGKEMEVDETNQSSLMGAIVLAREVTGDLASITQHTPHIKEFIKPDMSRNQQYMQQFERYLKLYEAIE